MFLLQQVLRTNVSLFGETRGKCFFLRVKNTNIFPLETAINLTRTNRISTELEQAPIELCGFL